MKRFFNGLFIAVAIAALLAMAGLAACSSSGGSSAASATSSNTSTGSASAASAASASSSSDSASAVSSEASASGASATTSASSASQSASALSAPATTADGKQLAIGTVVTTTYGERAAEVGMPGNDYAGDTSLLTLLVLDTPIEVTAYKGGSDYTGAASVIRLPNDEMFRQFSGKQITISVTSWGEWPADISAVLYDLVVDFDADGLDLAE